mmetsp:Transcript_22999/g.48965  ORF Transcript_22999/g.48965 Transcript_22999/m.48965 type:complete len:83 (-) Transcript_22999:114-362(-)
MRRSMETDSVFTATIITTANAIVIVFPHGALQIAFLWFSTGSVREGRKLPPGANSVECYSRADSSWPKIPISSWPEAMQSKR